MQHLGVRAWDLKRKRMLHVAGWQFHGDHLELWDMNADDLIWDENGKTGKFHDHADSYDLMYSIGLPDKNGGNIYEKDFIKLKTYSEKETICEIVYRNGCFFPLGEVEHFDCVTYYELGMRVDGNLEVIGNSYENSGLRRSL